MSSAETEAAPAPAVDCDVLVLGASFAGIELVHQLRRSRLGRALDIVVVDRQVRHPYIPLAHELVCDRQPERSDNELATEEVIAADPRARMLAGEVVGFDAEHQGARVLTADGERRVSGRFVVVALGSTIDPPEALLGREHFVTHKFRLAQKEAIARVRRAADADERARAVVVGAGITGVEVAGELAHHGDFDVTLVDGGARLLGGLHSRAGAKAERILQRQGVTGRKETEIEAHDGTSIRLKSGEQLPCDLAFWAGGIRPPPAVAGLNLPVTEQGWLAVAPTLQCFPRAEPGTPAAGVFAMGDVARVCGGDGEWATMQRAIECLWQAKTGARNILAALGERPLRPHRTWEDFPHGVSIGARSLVVYGPVVVDGGGIAVWFRRWLMAQYMSRYSPA